jgi:hypothetical protein
VKVILERILALPDGEVAGVLDSVLSGFAHRHHDFAQVLKHNFELVAHHLEHGVRLSEERRLLIGAYFTHEYSIEGALIGQSILAVGSGGVVGGMRRAGAEGAGARRGPPDA